MPLKNRCFGLTGSGSRRAWYTSILRLTWTPSWTITLNQLLAIQAGIRLWTAIFVCTFITWSLQRPSISWAPLPSRWGLPSRQTPPFQKMTSRTTCPLGGADFMRAFFQAKTTFLERRLRTLQHIFDNLRHNFCAFSRRHPHPSTADELQQARAFLQAHISTDVADKRLRSASAERIGGQLRLKTPGSNHLVGFTSLLWIPSWLVPRPDSHHVMTCAHACRMHRHNLMRDLLGTSAPPNPMARTQRAAAWHPRGTKKTAQRLGCSLQPTQLGRKWSLMLWSRQRLMQAALSMLISGPTRRLSRPITISVQVSRFPRAACSCRSSSQLAPLSYHQAMQFFLRFGGVAFTSGGKRLHDASRPPPFAAPITCAPHVGPAPFWGVRFGVAESKRIRWASRPCRVSSLTLDRRELRLCVCVCVRVHVWSRLMGGCLLCAGDKQA